MIYDDQPQMVEAAADAANGPKYPVDLPSGAKYVLRDAFDAIDREALIEKAVLALNACDIYHLAGYDVGDMADRDDAEHVLIAIGIIPAP